MSLHRVASIESWDRPKGTRAGSPTREPTRMTFNPVSDWAPPSEQPAKPVPVVEQISELKASSPWKRIAQVFIASLYCLLSSGLVFGFAALKPVLVAEGVYREYCTKEDPGNEEHACYEQDLRLNFMFALAAVATNVCALPVGTILDRYGPRVCCIIGSILLAVGSAFFIAAPQAAGVLDCYIPAYFFLALAGPFIFISSFQLSNCFPRNSGLILAILTGAFDTSSAMLLIYRLIYGASNGAFKPANFFTLYLLVPVFILVVQVIIMPSESYKTVGEMIVDSEEPGALDQAARAAADEAEIDYDDECNDEARHDLLEQQRQLRRESILTEFEPLLGKTQDEQIREEEHRKNVSGVWGALHGRSALQQIATPWFVLITALVVVQMTRINYFVATIRSQYTELFDGDYDRAVAINNFFDVALPAGGVLSIPFIGLLLDNLSTTVTLAVLTGLASLVGVLGVLPYMWAGYGNVILFVLFRPLYYTAVSDYAAKVFGFHTFGKVYGLIICLAGLGNFSQSGLDALTHRAFHDNPVPVNIMLFAAVAVIGTVLVIYVWRQSRSLEHAERDELEAEAEHSEQHERLLPAATDRPGTNSPSGMGYGATTNGNA